MQSHHAGLMSHEVAQLKGVAAVRVNGDQNSAVAFGYGLFILLPSLGLALDRTHERLTIELDFQTQQHRMPREWEGVDNLNIGVLGVAETLLNVHVQHTADHPTLSLDTFKQKRGAINGSKRGFRHFEPFRKTERENTAPADHPRRTTGQARPGDWPVTWS